MKLTIIRLLHLSQQDSIDLAKIWPNVDSHPLTAEESHRLYAARFNDRLLAAALINQQGERGELVRITVREVTRKRGVGRYLMEEILRDNPGIKHWTLDYAGIHDRQEMAGFMMALGFEESQTGWQKKTPSV